MMAITHAALDLPSLSVAANKLVGESAKPSARKMVAQGLAPLPPRDLGLALYQIWVTDLDGLAGQAKQSVESLPENVVMGIFDAPDLPAQVIDWLTRRRIKDATVLGRALEHANTDDETWSAMASVGPEEVCERIANNQERWTQAPEIVAALYENPNCRQSLIHRVLEFAVRAGLEVPIPMMDEIRKAMGDCTVDPSRDEALSSVADPDKEAMRVMQVAEGSEELDERAMAANQAAGAPVDLKAEAERRQARHAQLRTMSPMEKIRAALLGSAADRSVLVRDNNKTVAMAAIKCPRVRDNEVVAFSADRSLTNDVIRYIASRREWIKLYAVKVNLVMNPKTPVPRAMALLSHLSRKDLAKVARSKNVSSTLQKAAKRKTQGAA